MVRVEAETMKMKTTTRGKCPQCLPDGGAIFTLWGSQEWKCNNCGYIKKRIVRKPSSKPTASQRRLIERLKAFGGEHKIDMIGRNVFIIATNYDGRKWFEGQSFFGTIGPKGRLDLTLQGIGRDVKITDEIGIRVYLDPASPRN